MLNKSDAGKIVFEAVKNVVDSGLILEELTKKNGTFRKTTPKNAHPLTNYVHRMIEFYSNINPHIPSQIEFFIQDFADEVLKQKGKRPSEGKILFYLVDEYSKPFYHLLDNLAEEYCVKFGLNPNGCLRSWKGLFGY